MPRPKAMTPRWKRWVIHSARLALWELRQTTLVIVCLQPAGHRGRYEKHNKFNDLISWRLALDGKLYAAVGKFCPTIPVKPGFPRRFLSGREKRAAGEMSPGHLPEA